MGPGGGSWLPLFCIWKLAGLGWSCDTPGLIFVWFLIFHPTPLGFSHSVGKDLRERGSIQDLSRSRVKTKVPLLLPSLMNQSNVQDQLIVKVGKWTQLVMAIVATPHFKGCGCEESISWYRQIKSVHHSQEGGYYVEWKENIKLVLFTSEHPDLHSN